MNLSITATHDETIFSFQLLHVSLALIFETPKTNCIDNCTDVHGIYLRVFTIPLVWILSLCEYKWSSAITLCKCKILLFIQVL